MAASALSGSAPIRVFQNTNMHTVHTQGHREGVKRTESEDAESVRGQGRPISPQQVSSSNEATPTRESGIWEPRSSKSLRENLLKSLSCSPLPGWFT